MFTRRSASAASITPAAVFVRPRLLGGIALLAVACASAPSGRPDEPAGVASAQLRSTITAAELADPAIENSDLLTAVRRLRPAYLLSRGSAHSNTAGGATMVYLDNRPLTSLATLGTIRVGDVSGVEYLTVIEASQRFGNAARSGAVIVVHLN